jgi:hypothetical protein
MAQYMPRKRGSVHVVCKQSFPSGERADDSTEDDADNDDGGGGDIAAAEADSKALRTGELLSLYLRSDAASMLICIGEPGGESLDLPIGESTDAGIGDAAAALPKSSVCLAPDKGLPRRAAADDFAGD